MKQHTMACEFPEGCSCGAAEWNAMEELCRIYFEIAAECLGEDEVRKRRDARIANPPGGEGSYVQRQNYCSAVNGGSHE